MSFSAATHTIRTTNDLSLCSLLLSIQLSCLTSSLRIIWVFLAMLHFVLLDWPIYMLVAKQSLILSKMLNFHCVRVRVRVG